MRRVAVVGAGQSGLQVSFALRAEGYEVTLYADRTPEEVRSGRISSTQVMFGPALALESAVAPVPDEWIREAPAVCGNRVNISAPPGSQALSVLTPFAEPARSVDQRLKYSTWLGELEERGARVEYGTVDGDGLRRIAARHDLTLVAAGRGELARLFPVDPDRTVWPGPQRKLAALYVHGAALPTESAGPPVHVNPVPGSGELILMPALTLSGPCWILLCEAVPDGPLDVWSDRPGPEEQLRRFSEQFDTYLPWFAGALTKAEPADALAGLYGSIAPTVRRPVAELGDGRRVLGMADTLVVNDPVAGQGSNSAARCADVYARAIRARGGAEFDEDWMHATFETYWAHHARHSTALTNLMLAPLPAHVEKTLGTAAVIPAVAARFGRGYEDPATLAPWLFDAQANTDYLATVGVR